jgi:hypothetical protein
MVIIPEREKKGENHESRHLQGIAIYFNGKGCGRIFADWHEPGLRNHS